MCAGLPAAPAVAVGVLGQLLAQQPPAATTQCRHCVRAKCWSAGIYLSLNKNDSEPIFLRETLCYGVEHGAESHKLTADQESALFPCPGQRTHLANC